MFKIISIKELTFLKLNCRSQWPRGLRRRSAAARLLRLWVRIPPGTWMSVCFECCVLSGRGLCDELITRPEESYRLWCVVCDLETSWMRRPWSTGRCCAKRKKNWITEKKTIIPKCIRILQGHRPLVKSISTSLQKEDKATIITLKDCWTKTPAVWRCKHLIKHLPHRYTSKAWVYMKRWKRYCEVYRKTIFKTVSGSGTIVSRSA